MTFQPLVRQAAKSAELTSPYVCGGGGVHKGRLNIDGGTGFEKHGAKSENRVGLKWIDRVDGVG